MRQYIFRYCGNLTLVIQKRKNPAILDERNAEFYIYLQLQKPEIKRVR